MKQSEGESNWTNQKPRRKGRSVEKMQLVQFRLMHLVAAVDDKFFGLIRSWNARVVGFRFSLVNYLVATPVHASLFF